MFSEGLASILRCPETGAELRLEQDRLVRGDGRAYPIVDDIPRLVFPETLAGDDARWQRFYDHFASLYDLNERLLGGMLAGVNVRAERARAVSLLGLEAGMRLLEVSPGPGVYQGLLRERLGKEGVHVAADLSANMLARCRARNPAASTVLVQANGSYLPFADDVFDAVFHFGGVNLFSEPERALDEFVRVARPGGIVAWGDEGFSARIPDGWRKRFLPRLNPGYARPRLAPPQGIVAGEEHEVFGGFAYLMVARKAARESAEGTLRNFLPVEAIHCQVGGGAYRVEHVVPRQGRSDKG